MEYQDMAADSGNMRFKARTRGSLRLYRLAMSALTCIAEVSLPLIKCCSRRVRDGEPEYYGLLPEAGGGFNLWVHGVSMGESMVAVGFAQRLKKEFPDADIVFSTTHPDVRATVEKKKLAAAVAYFPLDNRRTMCEAFERWNPAAVFIAETDFWPEFSYQCRMRGIPLILINGRISSKISAFYRCFAGLADLVFSSYSLFLVQSAVDMERLVELGVDSSRVRISGNIKADLTAAVSDVDLSDIAKWRDDKQLLVMGSLHPDEFTGLMLHVKDLVGAGKTAVVIAPRNPANAQNWQQSLKKIGVESVLKSRMTGREKSRILILDTMGELAAVYSLADVAFVGGSFAEKIGGHNPLEVVQQGVPLMMGPGYRNFADIVDQLRESDAMVVCQNFSEFRNRCEEILADRNMSIGMVERASMVLQQNCGALDRTVSAVSSIVKSAVKA